MSDGTRELWTIAQVAAHIGASSNGSARRTLSRWGVRAATYQPGPHRVQARYNADQVRAAAAARPGRGARTDLHTPGNGADL